MFMRSMVWPSRLCWILPGKLKDKLVEYSVDALASKSGAGAQRKNVGTGKETVLDSAVVKWYAMHSSDQWGSVCVA